MIAEVLEFLRARLNKALPRDTTEGAVEDLFVYVGTDKVDSMSFKPNAVSIVFLRIEEDTLLRSPDIYARVADGVRQKVEPEIRLNLSVLLVARFPEDYSRSLHHLSRIIRYFQNHRVFNPASSPDLPDGIPQLVLELITPTFGEQNEIWGALRSAYQPSVMYRVKLIVFRDEQGQSVPDVKRVIPSVAQDAPPWTRVVTSSP
jgi:hypothetical protein